MGSIVKTIGNNASIKTTDANIALTVVDSMHQVFTGFTASRDVTLPSTGVLAGDTWRLENTTNVDMVVKAFNGSALTVANGTNLDATIQKGVVLLRATQVTPTTPAHWRVVSVDETTGSITGTTTGAVSQSFNLKLTRHNENVWCKYSSNAATATGVNQTINIPAATIPARFRPSNADKAICVVRDNGIFTAGYVVIQTDGSMSFAKYNETVYTNSSGLSTGVGTQFNTATWVAD